MRRRIRTFSSLKEELEFVQLAVNQRDNFRIRENVSLPAGKPEIQEIIWDDVDVRNLNTRLADDGLKLAGDFRYICNVYRKWRNRKCAMVRDNSII